MVRKTLGYFVIVLLVVAAAAAKIFHDRNEKYRREIRDQNRVANLQPELSPPPPDEMWAQKSPTPNRRGLQMMERPTPSPSPSPGTSPQPNTGQIEPLKRDRDQLLRQIWQLTPTQIDQQTAQRNRDLQQLRGQLNQYSTALQNLSQQSSDAYQFRSILQQSTINELDDRIRIQERLLASTREEMGRVTLNPQMFDPGTLPALQTQDSVLYQQLQNLLAQRSTISAQSLEAMQTLNQQLLTSRGALETARLATLDQIRYVEQDLARLAAEKSNVEALRQQYQREANSLEEELRGLGADQQQLKTITFP